MKSENSPVSDVYTLSRGSEEQDRLNKQHKYLTEALLDGRLIFDQSFELKEGATILDSATGTGSWIFAMSKEASSDKKLIGADISSAMFPSSYPSNIRFVEASVTNMPEDWENSIDFINQRLLVAALTEVQWKETMREALRVLKPGGAAQFIDIRSYYPVGDGLSKTEEVRKMSRALLKKRGQLSDCGNRIPDFAREAGFVEVQENVRNAPIGKTWGLIGEMGTENFRRVLHGFASAAIAEGLYNSDGYIHTVVEDASKEWDSIEGCFFAFSVVTVRKPL